jgi:O-phospho-L-seryl-tRNASec:L-selenocysteinyl-tRNA synthase
MVPVGGSVITSGDREIIKKISEIYPGRASAAPVMDLLITLLSMGKKGWSNLL